MDRVRSTAELIAYLPHLVGHHPQASLVCVLLAGPGSTPQPRTPGRQGGEVLLTARVDLPDVDAGEWSIVTEIATVLGRQPGAAAAVAVVYEDGAPAQLVTDRLLKRLERALRRHGVQVVETARVRAGRFRTGRGPGASAWAPVPGAHQVPAVTARVLGGSSPLRTRAELERLLTPGTDERAASVAASLRGAGSAAHGDAAAARRVIAVWDAVLTAPARHPHPLDVEDVTHLLLALQARELRDALILWACPLSMSPLILDDDAARLLLQRLPMLGTRDQRPLDTLTRTLALVPAAEGVDVLVTLGAIAWWWGRGDMARIAVEHGLRADPTHRLGRLLLTMIDHGVRLPAPVPA